MEDECMENMDNFRERLEALELQTKAMEAHTRTVERRLRWWRGIACGVVMLGILALTLPSGKAVIAQPGGLPERVEALEDKLAAFTFDTATNEVVITGANLRIVNGLGTTETTNGLGNLIVGYSESRALDFDEEDIRTGSHNVVVGKQHNFSRFGGVVVGRFNTISGDFTSVSGGEFNTASGDFSSVSVGFGNTASAFIASVSGGGQNTASGPASSVSGGQLNTASGDTAAVSGGNSNMASGAFASVSGGEFNTASGRFASVSGGLNRTAPGEFDWVAGHLFADF
jgi:hypothetical protein